MNLLKHETSPYLLQHKDNPVHWLPWGEEAFDKAKRENKPVLLSVGYSSCHWCHVMAHESFEDPQVAALMNDLFVNIKVDREERPDVDMLYQQSLSLMGQQGGWPLTMFLDADKKPFWGGTYFPPQARHGLPSFAHVLQGVARSYVDEKDAVAHNGKSLQDAVLRLQRGDTQQNGAITPEIVAGIADHFLTYIDPVNGGLGTAPKFPQLAIIGLLWDFYARTGQDKFKAAVISSLAQMCQGGIYDHAGGGFHRYTVDDAWLVPHFEKMLYDNALFVSLLADVCRETQNPLFAARLRETAAFMRDEMTAQDAFVTSFDADSEGAEGKFYVWQEAEIDKALGADSAFFKQHYDITKFGNWENSNILNRLKNPGWLGDETEKKLAALLAKLKAARHKREKPFRDDKLLADLNGLAIAAFAKAAFALDDAGLLQTAIKAFDSVAKSRLVHTGKVEAFLDDYAYMIEAALQLFQSTSDARFYRTAKNWADIVLNEFQDREHGGFFMSLAETAQGLRLKSAHDNPLPSGNGVMIANLAKLYLLTGDKKYDDAAALAAQAFAGAVRDHFFPYATLLRALSLRFHPLTAVTADGAFDQVFRSLYVPDLLVLKNPPAEMSLAKKAGPGTIFLCAGFSCLPPITDTETLREALVRERRHKPTANDD